jgi:gas vesicle structural protein
LPSRRTAGIVGGAHPGTEEESSMTVSASSNRYIDRPSPSSLADVIDTILDKGLVVDVYVRASLLGIEVIALDARVVIASVDTYLRFAEAVNRLDLTETQTHGVVGLVEDTVHGAAKGKVTGVVDAAADKVTEWLTPGE